MIKYHFTYKYGNNLENEGTAIIPVKEELNDDDIPYAEKHIAESLSEKNVKITEYSLYKKECLKMIKLENIAMMIYVGTLFSIVVILYLWLIGVI